MATVIFTCPHHNYPIEEGNEDGCPQCLDAALNGTHPLAMLPEERAGRARTDAVLGTKRGQGLLAALERRGMPVRRANALLG